MLSNLYEEIYFFLTILYKGRNKEVRRSMKNQWEKEFSIQPYDVDFQEKMRVSHLFQWMQEMASEHAHHIGVGYDVLWEQKLIWILSRMKLKIRRYPHWGEKVRIQTWAKGVKKLFAMRDFYFLDEQGEVFAGATTAWMLLSMEKKRPQRLEPFISSIPTQMEKHGVEEFPGAIPNLQAEEASHSIVVKYSHLDIHQHANNTKYIDWIFDAFALDELEGKNLQSIQLNFLNEALYDDTLYIYRDEISADKHILEGRRQRGRDSSEEPVFQAEVVFS